MLDHRTDAKILTSRAELFAWLDPAQGLSLALEAEKANAEVGNHMEVGKALAAQLLPIGNPTMRLRTQKGGQPTGADRLSVRYSVRIQAEAYVLLQISA